MAEKKYHWHKVAESELALEWSAHGIAVASLEGKPICLGRFEGKLFAFAYQCPHAGGLFSEGWVDPLGNVVCPHHRYKFSMANGRNVSGEGYHLKHWPVEMRADGLYAGVEDRGIFGWLR